MNDDIEKLAAEAAVIAAPVFEREGWTWGGFGGEPAHTPTVEEIEEMYLYLAEETQSETSCGRLTVRMYHDDEDDGLEGIVFGIELATAWE